GTFPCAGCVPVRRIPGGEPDRPRALVATNRSASHRLCCQFGTLCPIPAPEWAVVCDRRNAFSPILLPLQHSGLLLVLGLDQKKKALFEPASWNTGFTQLKILQRDRSFC